VRQRAFGLFAHDGSIGQLSSERNLAAEAHGLDAGTKALLVANTTSEKPGVGGFVHYRGCNYLRGGVTVANKFFIKHAGPNSRFEAGNVTGRRGLHQDAVEVLR
jgi:hypothetical protein